MATAHDPRADRGGTEPVVILVGLTAGWRKRRHARRYFREAFGPAAWLPWIPYALGLRASAAWLSFLLRHRLRGQARFHLIAYIGGGVLFRQLCARDEALPLGRAVWDRSAPQEQVARRLLARVPAFVMTVAGQRAVVDLARTELAGLAFPASALGSGLIVEARPSRMARRLGIAETSGPDLVPDAMRAMLPGAAAIVLPLSHDEVYDDPRFLDQAAAFIRTGSFLPAAGRSAP